MKPRDGRDGSDGFCCIFESHWWWGEEDKNSKLSQDWLLQMPQMIKPMCSFHVENLSGSHLENPFPLENRIPKIPWSSVKPVLISSNASEMHVNCALLTSPHQIINFSWSFQEQFGIFGEFYVTTERYATMTGATGEQESGVVEEPD